MSCSTEVGTKVYEDTQDIGLVHDVMSRVAEMKQEKDLAAMGDRFGYYLAPSEKIGQYKNNIDKLIGKTIVSTNRGTDKSAQIKVKTVEYVDSGVIAINGNELTVRLTDATISMDGMNNLQVMGSSSERSIKGTKLTEINGSVVQNLDKLVTLTQQQDGAALPEDYKGHLQGIFNTYKNVLMEASKDVEVNVEFFKALDEFEETKGSAAFGKDNNNKIKLLMGNTQYRTNTEVLAEELQHILIKNALQNNDLLRLDVEKLRKAMAAEFNERYNGNGYKLFLAGLPNPTSMDIQAAKDMFEYAFNNKTNPAEEFLAHATTNQAMVRAMAGITSTNKLEWLRTVQEKDRDSKVRVWAKLWNQIVTAINGMYAGFVLKGKTAHEYALEMMSKLLEFEHKAKQEEEKNLYQKALGVIGLVDKTFAKFTGQIDTEYRDIEEFEEKDKGAKARRLINKLWKIRWLAKARSFALQNNILNSISRNMKNKDVAKFYEMFRHSKEFVEKEVVAYKRITAESLTEEYKLGKVEKGLRKAAKRVLIDIDGQVLGKSKEIAKYLADENLVKQELEELTRDYSVQIIRAIDDMADLLVHNKTNNMNVFTNATQIAYQYIGDTSHKITDQLDKAITLRAMQKLDKGDKALALKALEQEPEGMDFAMELMRAEKKEILDRAYKGNRLQETKGAKQEQYTKDMKRYVVDEAEMKDLVKAKLTNLGKHEELSELLGKNIYTVVGDNLDVRYTEGLLKIVQLSNEGESLKHLLIKLGDMEEKDAEARIEYLRKSKGRKETTLVPERNGYSGEIYDYRIRVAYADKVKYMSMDDDIITTVAATVANLTHKQHAMLDNYATLNYLRGYYKDYKDTPENTFVEIGPDSKGKIKEYWNTLPYYIKNKITEDGKPLMVTESMLVDLFGYKDASIINLPWVRDKKRRQLVAKKIGSAVMEMIGYFKMQLVALTPDTIVANNVSNMVMVMTHTHDYNPLAYMSKYKKVWGMMNEYQDVRKRVIDLKLQQKAGKKEFDRKIQGLESTLANNPVHVIFEDGQYNVIFEDLNTEYFDNEGIIEGKINEVISKIDGKKGRGVLKKVVDTVYLRKESVLHDSVMKATTYSDAISKMIMLMDAKEKAQEYKKQGMTNKAIGNELMGATASEIEALLERGVMPTTWLNYEDMMFVNYGYLDNKYIKFANDMGRWLFTKYLFRVLPAMTKLLMTKGASVMVEEVLQKLTMDISTPYDIIAHPLNSLLRRMSLYTRPEDLFTTSAPGPIFRFMFGD